MLPDISGTKRRYVYLKAKIEKYETNSKIKNIRDLYSLSAWSDGQCLHNKNTMHCPPHAGPHSFVNISTTNGEQF
jgi:hypothetical protein